MKRVEILYFDSCPTWRRAEEEVRRMLSESNIEASLRLVPIVTNEDAQRLRFLGSPTVRVDGVDVDPSSRFATSFGLQCRLYEGATGMRRVPDTNLIRAALGIPGSAP